MSCFVPVLMGHTFTDVTESHIGNTGTAPHSITFADINHDGYVDLYVTMYLDVERPDLLFINQGDGTFKEEADLRGVSDKDGGSHGACFTDLDNDGDYDLFNGSTRIISTDSGEHNDVFINDGNGYFEDITSSIASISRRKEKTRTVLSLDIDNDGWMDLFGVSGYKGTADNDDGIDKNEVYLNLQNLDFESVEAGDAKTAPMGQGAIDTDYDGDGDMDIIAANRTGDMNILRNRGNGIFDLVDPDDILFPKIQIQAVTAGIEYTCQVGDGISMGDVDNDGDLDMLLVTFEAEEGCLYLNRGDGTFSLSDQSWTGIEGFMGNFADLDHDGDLDLIFTGTRWVWMNDGTGHFPKENRLRNGLQNISMDSPRALSFADIDRDGDLDFGMADKYVRASLVRNDLDTLFHWLQIELIAPNGQAGAFGSRAWVHASTADSTLLGMREMRSNVGYLAQNEPILHFGLNVYESVDVTVRFLDGTVVRKENVAADQRILIDGSASETALSSKVFLSGAFDAATGAMRTDLQDQNLLPLTSPYEDAVEISTLPDNITDWIFLEIYSDTSQAARLSQSCLLRSDGTVLDAENLSSSFIVDLPKGNYFARVRHRNHLSVTSPLMAFNAESVAIDWTQMDEVAQIEIQTNAGPIHAMRAGNGDAQNESIDANDLLLVKQDILGGCHGYFDTDVNLDGHVFASDYALVKEALQ